VTVAYTHTFADVKNRPVAVVGAGIRMRATFWKLAELLVWIFTLEYTPLGAWVSRKAFQSEWGTQ
jgi:hypothetical protein